MNKLNQLLFILILTPILSFGATFTCTSSGDWNLGATWGNGGDNVEGSGYPGTGDDVIIKNGATVTVNVSDAKCASMSMGSNTSPNKGDGTLSFNSGSKLTTTGTVTFGDGGKNGYIDMTSGGEWEVAIWLGKKGSFTYGTGKVIFTGAFSLTNSSDFDDFYDLEIQSNFSLSSDINIHNDLTLTSGTFDPSQKEVNLYGNWINNGGSFDEGTHNGEIVNFIGSSAQEIQGGETFNKVIINNSNGITIVSGDVTINTELEFTTGDITLGSNNLYLGSSGDIVNPSSGGHINTNSTGEFRKLWSASNGQSFTFPLGNGSDYTPFSITINSGTYGPGAYVKAILVESAEPNVSDDDYITRYWTVSAYNILNANYDWSATYLDSDVVGEEGNLYGFKWDGAWLEFNEADTIANTISGNAATSFSNFTAKKGLVTLPIEFTSFDITYEQGYVNLFWTTASEVNNDYFEIEKSLDGENWIVVERVQGAGNSFVSLDYTAIDFHPSNGQNYYRLKQVDFDGTTTYFDIRLVSIEMDSNISLYPNPSSQGQTIFVTGEQIISIKVFNMEGSLVETIYGDQFTNSFEITTLSSGNYIVSVHQANGTHNFKMTVR